MKKILYMGHWVEVQASPDTSIISENSYYMQDTGIEFPRYMGNETGSMVSGSCTQSSKLISETPSYFETDFNETEKAMRFRGSGDCRHDIHERTSVGVEQGFKGEKGVGKARGKSENCSKQFEAVVLENDCLQIGNRVQGWGFGF